MNGQEFCDISDDELQASLGTLLAAGARLEAKIVAHLAEIEERRLHLLAGYSSLYDYCRKRLELSDYEAFARIAAARTARKYPIILDMLAQRKLHLTAICDVREFLTAENHRGLLEEVSGQSKLLIREVLARRFPQADVRSNLKKLPELNPLSPGRYGLRLTLSAEQKDKLERARALLSHANPTGDLARVIERALDALIMRLEQRRFGQREARGASGVIQPANDSPGRAKTHEARTHEARTHEARTHEAKLQEARTHEAMAHEAMAHKAMARKAMARKAMAHEAMAHEAMAHEAIPNVPQSVETFGAGAVTKPREAKPNLPPPIESSGAEGASKPRETKPREAKPREAEPREAEPREAKPREAEPREAEPREAKPNVPPPVGESGAGGVVRRRKHIRNLTRRELVARDGAACSFIGVDGRCRQERGFLQFHHRQPWARGGADAPENLALLCQAHNRLLAERDFGKARVQKAIDHRASVRNGSVA